MITYSESSVLYSLFNIMCIAIKYGSSLQLVLKDWYTLSFLELINLDSQNFKYPAFIILRYELQEVSVTNIPWLFGRSILYSSKI